MVKTVDLSRGDPRKLISAVKASADDKKLVYASGRGSKPSPYTDQRWRNLRALLVRGPCLYCNQRPAALLDHHMPVSAGGQFFDPNNLVPCCRTCHDTLTKKYDAAGGLYGNVKQGKPDPRNAAFYARVAELIESGKVANAMKVQRRTARKTTKPVKRRAWEGDCSC